MLSLVIVSGMQGATDLHADKDKESNMYKLNLRILFCFHFILCYFFGFFDKFLWMFGCPFGFVGGFFLVRTLVPERFVLCRDRNGRIELTLDVFCVVAPKPLIGGFGVNVNNLLHINSVPG